MNDAAWQMFVDLSTKMQEETGDLIERQIESLEARIDQLEQENRELCRQIDVFKNTSLFDLVV